MLGIESGKSNNQERDKYLKPLGFTFLRFSNEEVLFRIDDVIQVI